MMPKLSIIIPCFNGEKWIERCLSSICSQSFGDFEVIVVNDGSTDSSLEVLNNIAQDRRVRVISQPNKGVSASRNIGLECACGEWISFVDIDDVVLPDGLFKLVSLSNDGVDIVFAGFEETPNANGFSTIQNITEQMDNNSLAKELFEPTDFNYIGYPWGKLFRRSIIEDKNIRFDESIKYNEDRLFTFEFLSHARRGVYTTTPVYNYIQHGDNAMSAINGPNFWKFETDLDAFVKMNEIAKRFHNAKLTRLVRLGAISSYNWNKRLNATYGGSSEEINRRLRKKLKSAVPTHFILNRFIAGYKDAVLYKVKNLFK